MKPKNLLTQIAYLEEALTNFSFEELSAKDAKRLKASFDAFKEQLENKIWGGPAEGEDTQLKSDDKKRLPPNDNQQEMLIATVSHEIRTPLSGIMGFADLLGESKLSKGQLEQVNAIRSASSNLMDIINELLEYSKLSAGLEHFESVNFNFKSIVQDVIYLCNTLMMGKDVSLHVDQDPEIPEILIGDPAKLSQLLLNLLGNSIKFVEKGKIFLNISLIKKRKDQLWIEFVIADTGIGISEEDLKHIFDSFKQANQHTFSKYGGTGLGLNIVKQIVEKLNGELEVSSRLGVGTTFRFTLCYGRGKQVKTPAISQKKVSPKDIKGMRILVFEDNLMNQRLIEQRLKAWGCRTYITENTFYGLNLLENTQIDLVLMDLRMPVMNGFEVTRRIRSSENKNVNQIPIIALTADFTIEDKNECEVEGINDYILKPFRPEELLKKLVLNKDGQNQIFKSKQPVANKKIDKDEDPQVIDLKPALEDCMGDLSVLRELIQLYKQNALEFIGKVKVHLKNEDFTEIRNAAHKIKCGLAMMQTHSLYFIVEQMHNNCRTTRDISHLGRLYDCFVQKYPLVEEAMEKELERMEIKGTSYDE